ncbi:MAG: cytochrome c oxidase assembly protein [Actinobacteria bacterium]|nr:cytochrome c oxidase assembly protein [Actinomycetota bacterium]NBP54591.1 cytochrome c oxidase assembly protein [Actinomycetota bacterium]
MIAEAANPLLDPWRFQAHPELWLLVTFLVGAYVYSVRVIGPQAVVSGPVVTRKNVVSFVAAMTILWLASDWPLHDLAEEYLYSMHMLQHMALAYFVPPLALLALPEWMFRALVGEGPAYRVVRWFSKPVIAGVLFNVVVMVTHIPALVNRSASSSPVHYSLHVLVVTTALLMWIPICGPAAELRMGYGGKMIYLFLMSVVPTVPAGWLTFAEGVVYKHYDTPVRVWGMSVATDQQLAGAIMKIGGSIFLWSIVIFMFFKRFAGNFNAEQNYVRDATLTYEQVEQAFESTPPAPEPRR